MITTVDIPTIQQKLYENLKESGWANLLKSFLLSVDFTEILEKLYNLSTDKKRFTPALKDIFNAFIECPYKNLHTVIITKEPITDVNVSNGIPFDCSRSGREHPHTTQLFDAVQRTIYLNEPYNRDLSLSRWSNQGVLLLSSSLTVQIDKSSTHIQLWKPFMAFLLDTLNIYNQGLHFVFMGDDVKHLNTAINVKRHYKFSVPHPSTAAQNRGIWDSQNIFPILTQSIQKNYKQKIIW